MPKTPIDYSKSIIYKIEHIDKPELVYVGSTTNFTKRKCQHKCASNNKNYMLYQMIRDNNGWDSFKMMIIYEFPCNSKIELVIEEERHRKELQASLNSRKSFMSKKETIEQKKQNYKIYCENNKEKIKEYYNNNRKKRVEYEKEYRKKNKEVLLEKRKEYYNNNIKEQRKESCNCICGSTFTISNKLRHEKSIKHINFINNNLEQFNDTFHCNDIFHCG